MKKLFIILSLLAGIFFLASCGEEDNVQPDTPITQPTPTDSVQLFFDWLKGKKWECDSVDMNINLDESQNVIFRDPQYFLPSLYKDTLFSFNTVQPSGYNTYSTFQINYTQKTVTMKGNTYQLTYLSETRFKLQLLPGGSIYKYKLVGTF